jgi:hypothetical protein
VAVVDEKCRATPEGMGVVVRGIADGGPAHMGEKGCAFELEGLFAVLFALVGGLDLPDAPGRAVDEAGEAPAVGVREAACVVFALIEKGILGVEKFARGPCGMGGP